MRSEREEVRDLAVWCKDNNLSLNVSKTNELIVDYRKWLGEHAPIHIDGAAVERVEELSHLLHSTSTPSGVLALALKSSKCCTVESILTSCITACYGNSTTLNCMCRADSPVCHWG